MSIESGIRGKLGEIQYSISRSAANFSAEVIPYILPASDALIVLASCLVAGIGYHVLIGGPLEVLPMFAVGSLASFIYILRMNSNGYYGLQESAKPRLEVREILVCWFTTGLLLALIAFLLKISAAYSRGAFIIFYILAPVALLGARKATKIALARAVAEGALGRGDTVLIGDPNEMATLQRSDLLTLFGALEARRFALRQEDDELGRPSEDARIISAAASFVRLHNCRQVLIALPWSDIGRIGFVREEVQTRPVSVHVVMCKG